MIVIAIFSGQVFDIRFFFFSSIREFIVFCFHCSFGQNHRIESVQKISSTLYFNNHFSEAAY